MVWPIYLWQFPEVWAKVSRPTSMYIFIDSAGMLSFAEIQCRAFQKTFEGKKSPRGRGRTKK